MKTNKRFLALLLTLCMILSLAPAVFAEEAAPLAAAEDIVIYYTNDVHTYIDGAISYDTVADLKTQTAEEAAGVLLIDAGDAIQGTAYGSMDKGATIIELMNAAGYDLATLGNHEFDYGMEGAMNAIEWADYDYVSANFYHEKDGVVGDTVLDAYKVFEVGGMKIAFVGITTPETFTKSTPAYFQDEDGNYIYGIGGGTDGKALYTMVQAAIDAASAEADLVIGLGHLGDDPASKPWTSEEVIANTSGFDAFIDGHSHSTVPSKAVKDKDGNDVLLTQTGEYFGAIGRMVINKDGIETGLINIVEVEDPETEEVVETYVALMTDDETNERTGWTLGSDEAVAEIKDAWLTEIDTKLGEVIGKAEVTLDNYDAEGKRLVRKQETNTGDFAADALYFLFEDMGLDVDVAIMNGGGVRNKAITGDISYKTCKEIHTFGNVACLQTITGQQLLDALEWGARGTPDEEIGGFLHVSGIKYTIDTSIPSTVQMDEKGVWTGAPTGEYRVKDVKILQNGEYVDLDLKAEYNLAGYNYTLRDLGDGFAMFDGAVNVLDYVMEDYMVLANYVENGLDGVIGEEYAEPAGRITILTPEPKGVVVYYTNDVHTYIDGDISYDTIAALKADTAAEGYDVLLIDAGDAIQGTAYGSMDKGATIVELMNAAGYDLATLGNHEFDYGMEGAMNAIEWADYDYVSANFYNEKDGVVGDTVLDAYKVFEVGGMKIAFVGITTPETFTKSTPAYFQDEDGNYIYGIGGGDDGAALYTMVQKAIDAAAAEADLVIALGHLGDDPASKPWTSEELIANTTGLDAFIDGHSHSIVPGKMVKDKAGNEVLLTQTGEYFANIGRMVINKDGIETGLISIVEVEDPETEEVVETYVGLTKADGKTEKTDIELGSDEAVAEIKEAWMTEIDEALGKKIGEAKVSLGNYDAEGNRLVRSQETNTGDFAADALYFLFEDLGLDVDVAIMNGGGVRNKAAITGDITYKTCKEIHTFGNVACLQTVTGQQLLDALEWGAKDAGSGENGGFLHVSGLKYTIDTSIPSTVQKDEKGVWTGAPTGKYRVTDVQILQDGKYVDLDLEATYNLAGYNYTLRDLGDGFAMFDGAVNVLDYVMEDYLVLANYIEKGLDGVIGEEYADLNGQGRITILVPTYEFEDVEEGKWYYDAVQFVLGKGMMQGMGDGTFAPDKALTRAQLVQIMYNIAGQPAVETKKSFSDVKAGDWFYDAVMWGAEKGVVDGMGDGTFAPNDEITREQMVTIIWRYVGKPEASAEKLEFTDAADVSEWAEAAVLWAAEAGVVKGMGDGTFAPGGESTRAQAAQVMVNYFGK